MKRPRKLSYAQLNALTTLEKNATNGRPWVDRFDVGQSTPTLNALVKQGYAEVHSSKNAWGWFEFTYRITAAGVEAAGARG